MSAQRDWLDANRDVVGGLIRAFAKAQKYVHDDPAGAQKIMRAVFPQIDQAAFLAACERNFPAVAADPSVRLDAIATAFKEFETLNSDPLTVTPEKIATNDYVAAALR